ncbi:hypothetical protein BDQ17DRAFT_1335269 [Cyathus striatus]|nr:hypothetical protein BDQ17DRAFT_1335269 [Cyathus striatus]
MAGCRVILNNNLVIVVNMWCRYLSVDLRDAIGDRLMLSGGFHVDGTKFDIGQATMLKIFGTLMVKRVTANFHITTLGHGEEELVRGAVMNLSHIITEFSFGPFSPEMVQPFDNSFEATTERGVFVCVWDMDCVCRGRWGGGTGKDKTEGVVAAQASGARMQSPYLPSPSVFASQMGTPAFGPGPGSRMFSPGVNAGSPATPVPAPLTAGSMLSVPPSPMVNGTAPGINGNGGGYVGEGHNGHGPPRRSVVSPKKDD